MERQWRRYLIALVFLLPAYSLFAQSKNDSVFSWSKISSFHLDSVTKGDANIKTPSKPLQLFIFLSPECPISKNYTSTLNELFNRYQDRVEFIGCISGKGFASEEITSFIGAYKIQYPLLIDESLQFTRYITATVTPEVILVDQRGQQVYKGAIDDWVQGLGKHKQAASKHYLQDAIKAFLQHKRIVVRKTRAFGCLINNF